MPACPVSPALQSFPGALVGHAALQDTAAFVAYLPSGQGCGARRAVPTSPLAWLQPAWLVLVPVTKSARSLWWFQKEHKPALERGMKINKPGLARGRRGLDCVCKPPASFLMQRCHGLPWLRPASLEALKTNELLKHTLLPIPCWPWLQIKFRRDLRHQECHQKKCSWPGFFFFAPQHSVMH